VSRDKLNLGLEVEEAKREVEDLRKAIDD